MKREWLSLGLIAITAGTLGAGMLPPVDSLAPPSQRDARDLGVGRYIPDVSATNLSGKPVSWRTARGDKLTVLALTSLTCPLSKKFAPTLARIEAAYAAKGVKFIHINVSGQDTAAEMQEQVKSLALKGLYLDDKDQKLTSALHAKTTTEVFVIDAANTLVYRGAISDQYGVGFSLDAPRRRFLENALDTALAGEPPAIAATNAPGCAIELAPAKAQASTVTYTKDIARIVQNSCVECHRSGGVAPFALDTFEAVSKRATMIANVTDKGIMPPWFAAPNAKHANPWANDRSLSETDKDAISAWVDAGKPQGDKADMPLARTFSTSEWSIGKPSAIFQLPTPIAIKADGVMPYQIVTVPTDLAEDKWVKGIQIIPTDKAVVHHVLVYVLPEEALHDAAARRRATIDEAGGFFAAYVPGNDAVIYPQGMAKRLPKKSVLAFQIHYTPNGKATSDQMGIGFLFGNEAPTHLVRTVGIAARNLNIPPGADNHQVKATLAVLFDAKILAFMPHMHVRGKAFRYELSSPDASRDMLLDIPRYDFNWQLRYLLKEPLDAPKGSTIHATAWYDNSPGNPANPDPSKTVRWGQQTYDEMMLGYVEYYIVQEDPSHPEDAPLASRGLSFESLAKLFDKNKDAKIEKSEAPERLHEQFDRLDKNKDGVLTKDDFAR
ncbi:MAG: redoxin family protein [Planctomycetota bacterium]